MLVMPTRSPHGHGQSGQVEKICRRIFRHLLQRGESCRQHIAEDMALSAASATNYSRWLDSFDFLETRSVKVATSKRPVEWMRLNPDKTVSIAITVTSRLVISDLVSADGERIWHTERVLQERCQHELMQVLEEMVDSCLVQARKMGQRCAFAGMSISGTVGYGIIFSMNGIPDWQPCTPTNLLPAFSNIQNSEIWTRIQCKMVGFSQQQPRGDLLGYFEWDGTHLRMASMRDGVVLDGRNGTVNARLHQPVKKDGPLCYCGRRGCFVALLESGEAQREQVNDIIENLTDSAEMDIAAVEWRGDGAPLQMRPGGRTELINLEPGEDFSFAGLRLLCTEEALVQAVLTARASPGGAMGKS